MAEFLGSKTISNQFLGNKVILRTYKGDSLINEYEPLYNPPSDWFDIRTDCPKNSIALYAAHTEDFSAYDNLGFIATCSGGYNVFIDEVQYGTTYASGATCTITWSTSGITTGDDITTPSSMKAHKIWISPATEGNNITGFHCARVAASGNEIQGILWAHFNIDNTINIYHLFADYSSYYSDILYSITSKNNILKTTSDIIGLTSQGADRGGYGSKYIEYLPIFNSQDEITQVDLQARSATSNLKTISLFGDSTYRIAYHSFQGSLHLEKIKTKKQMITNKTPYSAFLGNNSLKYLPDIDYSDVTNMQDFLTNAVNLQDTVLDVSSATGLRKIGCYGTSQYFMNGFKGLRVSNQAPFNISTAPQINVKYTGMDRSALVQLFNDLPYNVGYTVVGSPTINNGVVSGFSSSDYLTLPSFIRNNFKQLFKIKTPNSFIAYAGLWQENTTNYKSKIMFSNTGKIIVNLSSLGNSWDIADNIFSNLSLDTNKEYYIDFSYSDGYYTIKYSLDGETFNDLITPIESNSILRTAGSIIGYNSTNNVAFNGEIDLNNTYIKVNDVYWFRGQPTMTKTLSCVGCTGNQDKLTIVGSPTISNGVVSGFSGNNYLSLSEINLSNPFEILFEVKTPATWGSAYDVIFGSVTSNRYTFQKNGSNKQFAYYVPNESGTGRTQHNGNTDLLENKIYYIRTRFTGTQLIIDRSTDKTNWTVEWQEDRTVGFFSSAYVIGRSGTSAQQAWNGSIDLNNTYIKVDDELWFGRQQYLLPEDKAIATDKGWSLTLA